MLDFGLAKIEASPAALDSQAGTLQAEDLTSVGTRMGTVSYMSPEQARGEHLDARSDLFSFGVVLYEMVTGNQPFRGKSSVEVWDQILNRAPVAPIRLNPDVPAGLAAVIERCLEKDPAMRYSSAREALTELKRLRRDATLQTGPSGWSEEGGATEIRAAPETTGGASDSATPVRSRRAMAGATVIALVALASIITFWLRHSPGAGDDEAKTVAVLPFQNLNQDEENEFFAGGVHEDVMNKLASLGDLKVISRTSVMHFRDPEAELPEIAKRLGARYIVEGSVRRSDDDVRVVARLIDATTDQQLWSANYDRKLENVFALQSAIAQEIAGTLETRISRAERAGLEVVPTRVVAAYDDFLKARRLLNRSFVGFESLAEAIGLLESATAADPGFGQAWALLARAHSERHQKLSDLDDREAEMAADRERAASALAKAHELTPVDVETFKAEGYFYEKVEDDTVAAMRSLDRAMEIIPNDSETLFQQSMIYLKLQQVDQVVEKLERGYELDNANGLLIYGLTFAYEISHRYADMVPFFERLLELEPERTHYGIQAKYYQFLADGSLESYQAFEEATRTVRQTQQCDLRTVQNGQMVVAMMNDEFAAYAKAWEGKWDRHHRGHGNWACPAQINDEANHAHLLLEHGRAEKAREIIARARNSTTRPYTEMSMCIFDKAAFRPKLQFMSGEPTLARRAFDVAVAQILQNDTFPRGAVEKSVLLETADMVAPDRVYGLFQEIREDPISLVSLETVCANPWTFPNLLRDPEFLREVRADGRFVEFLEHFDLIPRASS